MPSPPSLPPVPMCMCPWFLKRFIRLKAPLLLRATYKADTALLPASEADTWGHQPNPLSHGTVVIDQGCAVQLLAGGTAAAGGTARWAA